MILKTIGFKTADSSVATVRNEAAGGMNEGEMGMLSQRIINLYEVRHFFKYRWYRGFGWCIDGRKLYIHQPHIPAIQGNKGFANEANARKAGEFIVLKPKRNIMPPKCFKRGADSLGCNCVMVISSTFSTSIEKPLMPRFWHVYLRIYTE